MNEPISDSIGDPIIIFIDVARDFSKYPGGRFKDDGPFSAGHLRDDLIAPHLSRGSHVVLSLDGTYGYGGSFLEEAFGGLVRSGYAAQRLRTALTIETKYPDMAARVWSYIDAADASIESFGSPKAPEAFAE